MDNVSGKGYLVPPIWDAEQLTELAYHAGPGWEIHDALVMAVAVSFAECDGYINSYHDNYGPDNKTIVSRDVGIWQINIPADDIGTHIESDLHVPANNAAAAYKLWTAREWEPWASFTSGIVFDDRYYLTACLGVLNYSVKILKEFQANVKDPARVANHNAPSPFLTSAQVRHLYPKILI